MVTKALTFLLLAVLATGCWTASHKADQYCAKAATAVREMIDGSRSDWRDAFDACLRDPREPWLR